MSIMRFVKFLNIVLILILSGCTPDLTTRSTSGTVQEIFETVKPELEKSGFQYHNTLTPDERNKVAQALFIRPAGQERQSLSGQQKFAPYSDQLYPLFKQLGDIDSISPLNTDYDYILINGSTVKNMRERIQTLVTLIRSKKIRLTSKTTIVFLAGERDLFSPDKEGDLTDTSVLGLNPKFKAPTTPRTEYEAAQWIWQQADLPDPLRSASIRFINAPKIQITDKSGQIIWSRPNTASTIKTWLESKPKPGTCLCISSQPFVYYQTLTTDSLLNADHHEFHVEGTGESLCKNLEDFSNHVDVFMDNLARTIYTETKQTCRQNSQPK